MPTEEQVDYWADDFEREYPEELPDRLRWFVEQLGVRKDHLLRLLGLPPERVRELASRDINWEAVVAEVGEASAWWAESAIDVPLRLYHYDWRGLKERLSRPVGREFEVMLPGGETVPASRLPADRREEILLLLASQDTEQAWQALIAYLSQPVPSVARS
jgi:hypothetical protein